MFVSKDKELKQIKVRAQKKGLVKPTLFKIISLV